jgi:hypothetical protein
VIKELKTSGVPPSSRIHRNEILSQEDHMGLDDLIKQKQYRKTSHHDHDEHHHGVYEQRDDHSYRHGMHHSHGGHHRHDKFELIRSIFQNLPHKKALFAGVLIIGIIMIIAGIVLLWALFPLIAKAAGYVDANGIRGVVEGILPYVDKLWKGNG